MSASPATSPMHPVARPDDARDAPVATADRVTDLAAAVQLYFDLMYDCDTSAFGAVFCPTVQLHGYRDGQFIVWPAADYKEVLRKRQAPKSVGAARRDEVLLMDFASDTMAFTKVRVRIVDRDFVDYLTWHRLAGRWVITSKGYHIEAEAV